MNETTVEETTSTKKSALRMIKAVAPAVIVSVAVNVALVVIAKKLDTKA